jgi:hypothetical protein
MESLTKQFKKAHQEVKISCQQMITNNNNFCCTTADITYQIDVKNEDEGTNEKMTMYPSSDEINKWMEELFEVELKYKEPNPRALEEMKKKGIEPKKQPRDIFLLVVIPSISSINIGISLPNNNDINIDISKFITDALYGFNFNIDIKNSVGYITCPHLSPMKGRDEIMLLLFNQLKKDKIYIEEEDDDECPIQYEL